MLFTDNLFVKNRVLYVLALFILLGCEENREYPCQSERIGEKIVEEVDLTNEKKPTYNLDSVLVEFGLVDVHSVDTTIVVDLKYASSDNFMGIVLYDTIKKAYLRQEVAERLSKSQTFLTTLHPGYRILIYDALRPVSVQYKMWLGLDSIPVSERGKYVSNPRNRSVHNFGCAVDVTILDQNRQVLDMGAGYDDFRPIAFPSLEKQFLKSGELTPSQYENRRLLRKVMRFSHFYNIPSEWWHFNAFSREFLTDEHPFLINESGAFQIGK